MEEAEKQKFWYLELADQHVILEKTASSGS